MERLRRSISLLNQSTLVSSPPSIVTLPQECLDCSKTCDHPKLPNALLKKIDVTTPLHTTMKAYSRHVLISTARNTSSIWPEKIESLPETSIVSSVIACINKSTTPDDRIVATLIDKNIDDDSWVPSSIPERPPLDFLDNLTSTEVIVLPDMVRLMINGLDDMKELKEILTTPRDLLELPADITSQYKLGSSLSSIVLICAHKKRDKRCSSSAELLIAEFERVLNELGCAGSIGVYGCSHVGGHKYAGNVIVYPQGDWYGRVSPCHVHFLVKEAVLGKKIVKDLWRGRCGSRSDEISIDW